MAKYIIWLIGVAVLIYASLVGVLFTKQRSMLYPGAHRVADRSAVPGFQEAVLRTADGLDLRAIYVPPRNGKPWLVFFHGNGATSSGAVAATRRLRADGYGLLLPEYRGYGGNRGTPSEAGLYADGEAALNWLRRQGVPLDQTLLIGNSLGSAVATELATRHDIAGLVVISGFTSLADVAAAQMRFVPARSLLRDRYENATKMPKIRAPVLVLHGTADTLVPVSHGVGLAGASQNATFITIPGAGHELAYLPAAQTTIMGWLNDRTALAKRQRGYEARRHGPDSSAVVRSIASK